MADSPRVFRGWWVLAGVFLVMTTGSGFAFYAQGVFLDALVVEQGFSVGMAGAGTGLFFLVSGVAGYYAGSLISRFDIRAVIVAGATVAAIGIVLLGLVRNEWQMFGVFIIYGGGYAFTGLVPATSLVTRWFHVKRSVALSIASTGLSVGGIAITPIIAQLIDERSLVDLAPWLAVGYWVGIVVPTLLLLRPTPESLGLRPDGADKLPSGSAPEIVPGVEFATAVKTKFFRLFSAGFILIMGAQVGAIQHLFKLTKDVFDVDFASVILIVVTSTSVAARLAGGVAATKFPIRKLANGLVLVQAVGIATIGLAEQRWLIVVGVLVLGTAMGNLLMLHPLILADAFGVRDYPRIYGLGSLLMVTGVGLGPFVVGLIRDVASYRAAFLTMSGVALVGLFIVRLAGGPDKAWSAVPADGSADAPRTEAPAEEMAAASVNGHRDEALAFAAVTQDLQPATVGADDWSPDPSWQAPGADSAAGDQLPPSRLADPPGAVISGNGAHEDDSRFRRPPTILPIAAEADAEAVSPAASPVAAAPAPTAAPVAPSATAAAPSAAAAAPRAESAMPRSVVRRTPPPMPDSARVGRSSHGSARPPSVIDADESSLRQAAPDPTFSDSAQTTPVVADPTIDRPSRPTSVGRPPSVVESEVVAEPRPPVRRNDPLVEPIGLEQPVTPDPVAVPPVVESPVAVPPVVESPVVESPVFESPVPEPEPVPVADLEPVAEVAEPPVLDREPVPDLEGVQVVSEPLSGADGGAADAENQVGVEDPAPTSRFAVPMAIASTAVAVALMTWVRWLSRSDGEGPGTRPKG